MIVEVEDERLKVLAKGPRWVSLSSRNIVSNPRIDKGA